MLLFFQEYGFLIARILFVGVFFGDVIYNKIIHRSRSKAYMARFSVPFPALVLWVTVVVESIAALMILLDFYAFWGALVLFLFLLGITFVFHRFWLHKELSDRQNQFNHFMKNFSIMGGCLFLMLMASAA